MSSFSDAGGRIDSDYEMLADRRPQITGALRSDPHHDTAHDMTLGSIRHHTFIRRPAAAVWELAGDPAQTASVLVSGPKRVGRETTAHRSAFRSR